jgi:hypothetical protein
MVITSTEEVKYEMSMEAFIGNVEAQMSSESLDLMSDSEAQRRHGSGNLKCISTSALKPGILQY